MEHPFKPSTRIITSQTPKYIGKNVTVIGEVTNIIPHANTLTLRMPDDENMIILLPKNNSTVVEMNRLTEVSGRLVSRGQLESSYIIQYSDKDTAKFNKNLFIEAMQIQDAYLDHYQV